MTLREKINEQFNTALKSKNKTLVSTFRLILAAIKERDIANRSGSNKEDIKDPEIIVEHDWWGEPNKEEERVEQPKNLKGYGTGVNTHKYGFGKNKFMGGERFDDQDLV